MKKKLIAWLTARVDALLVTEAWACKRWAEAELDTIRQRCESYERTIDWLIAKNRKLIEDRRDLNQELYG